MAQRLSTSLNKVVLAGEVVSKIKQLGSAFSVVSLQIKSFNQFTTFSVRIDNSLINNPELKEGNRVELAGKIDFVNGKFFVIANKINKFFSYKNKVDLVGTLHSAVDTKNICLIHTGEDHKSNYIDTDVFVNYDNQLTVKKAVKEPYKPLHALGKLINRSYAADTGLTDGFSIKTLELRQF